MRRLIMVIFVWFFINIGLIGQPHPGIQADGEPAEQHQLGEGHGAPINGGIFFLLIIASVFASKKIYVIKKHARTNTNG